MKISHITLVYDSYKVKYCFLVRLKTGLCWGVCHNIEKWLDLN
jgi:hypothetical protein